MYNYIKKHFAQLTPLEQREALEFPSPEQRRGIRQTLPPEELLAALAAGRYRGW